MGKTTLLFLNPNSASQPEIRRLVKDMQSEASLDVRIPWSSEQMRQDLSLAVRNGAKRVIAGGGDGTLNQVVNAVLHEKLAETLSIGLLPLGTANDFARFCGDAGDDLDASLRRAVTGAALPTDVGEINGRHFINVASGGFGAMVTASTPKDLKRHLGGFAYTLFGLSRLADMRPNPCRITRNDGVTLETDVAFLAIGNARFAGGGFEVTPNAAVNDGLLDVAAICLPDSMAAGFAVQEILDPTAQDNRSLIYSQTPSLRLETQAPFHMNLDGEPMVDQRFEVRVLASAVRMVR